MTSGPDLFFSWRKNKCQRSTLGGLFSLQIIPGEGGRDSQLFAHDLSKIYLKHAQKHGLNASITSSTMRCINISISGENCDSLF